MGVHSGEMIEIVGDELRLNSLKLIAPRIDLLGLSLTANKPIPLEVQEFLFNKGIFPILLNATPPGDPLLYLTGLMGQNKLTKKEVDDFLSQQKKSADEKQTKDNIDSKSTPESESQTKTQNNAQNNPQNNVQKLEAPHFKMRFDIKRNHMAQLAQSGYYIEQALNNVDKRIARTLLGPQGILAQSQEDVVLPIIPDPRSNEKTRLDIQATLILSNKNIRTDKTPHFITVLGNVQAPLLNAKNCFGFLSESWAEGEINLPSLLSIRIQNSFLQAKGKITLNSKLVILEQQANYVNPQQPNSTPIPIIWTNGLDSSLHAFTNIPSISIERPKPNNAAVNHSGTIHSTQFANATNAANTANTAASNTASSLPTQQPTSSPIVKFSAANANKIASASAKPPVNTAIADTSTSSNSASTTSSKENVWQQRRKKHK